MVLILFQILAVLVAAFVAVFHIQSIIHTGPLLSLTGAVVAFRSYRRDRVLGLYLGLATPAMAVACFALICGLRCDPGTAQGPVMLILGVYALVHLPVGVGAC